MSEGIGKGTRAVHAGVKHDSSTGAIMTPVYLTSTYAQTKVGEHKGYEAIHPPWSRITAKKK